MGAEAPPSWSLQQWSSPGFTLLNVNMNDCARRHQSPLIADMNGNGVADIFTVCTCDESAPCDVDWQIREFDDNGDYGNYHVARVLPVSPTDWIPIAIDYEGDGRSDVLMHRDGEPYYDRVNYLGDTGSTNLVFGAENLFIDVNGDGLQDAVNPWSGTIRLNTGQGFCRAVRSCRLVTVLRYLGVPATHLGRRSRSGF